MKKILISNDDGYKALGLIALYKSISSIENVEVQVIAPESNNSGKSNAITIHNPLYVNQAENGFFYVNGTPADCIHVALTGYLDYCPDLIISGINNGANIGDDTIYSGTIGAAREGCLCGVPAIAFSQAEHNWLELDSAALKAKEIVQELLNQDIWDKQNKKPWLLNCNIPNLPLDKLNKIELCKLAQRDNTYEIIKQGNHLGETMYWIHGTRVINNIIEGSDYCAIQRGSISLTPLNINLNDDSNFDEWQSIKKQIESNLLKGS